MPDNDNLPQTLIDAVTYYRDPKTCFETMLAVKWPDGKITCPKCGGTAIGVIKTRSMLQCNSPAGEGKCGKQFSVKVGTIFEDSPLPLWKWLVAVWSVANCKNGISSMELGWALGVTQKTAWFMGHRIREAMKTPTARKLSGEIEGDETFVGGKAKNMHKGRRERLIRGRGAVGKAIVQGLLEQAFRFNNRDVGDGLRFQRVLSAVVGKRLTYRTLTAQGDAGFMGIQ